MGNKKCLNEKRLTRSQVQELINREGKLHQEYTQVLEETFTSGYVKRDLVYELSNDRFLLVFDVNDVSIPGKGDIYPKEYFLRMIRWMKKVKEDSKHNRGSSFGHWLYYSKNKLKLTEKIDYLIDELAQRLTIERAMLNFSYESLDTISEKLEKIGIDEIQQELYDNLVAYVGEVIRQRVDGYWDVDEVPFISINDKWIGFYPVNVVWSQLGGLDIINLRQETANEIRRNARFKKVVKAKDK